MKGKRGCFTCGAPTSQVLQVWFSSRTVTNGTRTIASIQRSFCGPCGNLYADRALVGLGVKATLKGCQRCQAPTTTTLRVWHRLRLHQNTDDAQKTITARTVGFCTPCGEQVFAEISLPLDPGTWRPDPKHSGGDLSRTRATQLPDARQRASETRKQRLAT